MRRLIRLNRATIAAGLCVLLMFALACNHPSQSAASSASAKRYALKGKVVSVDKNSGTADIDNEPIAGFMDAMTMPYTIKPTSVVDQLKPGDSISAEVVVEQEKYWLDNVKVIEHSDAAAGARGNAAQ